MKDEHMPNDDEVSVYLEPREPFKNVASLMGEGEKFFREQLYTKAIMCFSEVI